MTGNVAPNGERICEEAGLALFLLHLHFIVE